ncbi:uncharacterized protein [Antedon mediterranea]|uniref:uncharacterized protein n=1 Tax=Antedon mediterranea TaxID=105859 RepID=UPI003AF8550A
MRAGQCVIPLLAWVCCICYAKEIIYTSVGVIDPNPYVGSTQRANDTVNSRRRRSTVYSNSEIQAILDKHNELRSGVNPEASDMIFMKWDDDLATLAQEWSDTCTWDHGQPDSDTTSVFNPIGQNLWLGSGTADVQPDGVGATQAWYNEVSMYTYESRACTGVCGHYTQVVWADSYAVGCGITFCSETSEGQTNAWLLTCNYGPAGNYQRHPYLSGSSCTECSSGSGQCYNNQCRSCTEHEEACVCNQECSNCGTLSETHCNCTCPEGYMGNDCSELCEDTNAYCYAGWYPAQCTGYDYVREGCPLMCNECSALPDDFVCEEEDDSEAAGCSNECENGGTINSNTCGCSCTSEYQGNNCEENVEQVQNGVQITITAEISAWSSIESDLLAAVKTAIDEYCNLDENYQTCCPSSGSKTGDGTYNYIDTNDIYVGDGFPVSIDPSSFNILIYAVPEMDNELCAAGSSSGNRKRRDTDRLLNQRIKRDVVVYFDQDTLLAVITDSVNDISAAIGVPIEQVQRGLVIEEEEDEDDGGISDGVIAAIVIVVIAVIVAAFSVLYLVFRGKKSTKVENVRVSKSKNKIEDMEQQDVNI